MPDRRKPAPTPTPTRKPPVHATPTAPAPPTQTSPTPPPTAPPAPIFANPIPTADPTQYKVANADEAGLKEMDTLIAAGNFPPLPFPVAAATEPVLTLAAALGPSGNTAVTAIQNSGQIVFHCLGDTGATKGPSSENEVADKLVSDFTGEAASAVPQFFYHLGDIVYEFGEHQYYYDQFYEAFRAYPAPIFAIPGNHDGIVLPPPAGTGVAADTLAPFLANFCTPAPTHSPDALGISRTTMIQPGVYFTLEAPFVRILGLYSNVLEDPGVIAPVTSGSQTLYSNLTTAQLDFLTAALTRVKTENFTGAVLIAVHHPPYTFGTHTGSITMLQQIDTACVATGVWPHAVLSGHSHNYQRYTRSLPVGTATRQIPFLVLGNGGHAPLSKLTGSLRTPQPFPAFSQSARNDTVTFENYDFTNYGYARITVTATQLHIEYHSAADSTTTKTPDDQVTVALATGTLTTWTPAA